MYFLQISELVNALGEWLEKHVAQLRLFDCAAWVLTSAILNLDLTQYPKLNDKVKTVLVQENIKNPTEWVNIVHAMSVLNQVSTDLISSVLAPEFIEKFGMQCTKRIMANRIVSIEYLEINLDWNPVF